MPKRRRQRGHIQRCFGRSFYLFGAAGSRRNPGRMDGVQWNSNKMYICPAIVDGQYADTHFEDDTSIEAFEEEATPVEMRSSEPMTVSILEITRPTKLKVLKGVEKEFEIVRRPQQRVIALEDKPDGLDDLDDDWDRIYVSEAKRTRTYSAVLMHGGAVT